MTTGADTATLGTMEDTYDVDTYDDLTYTSYGQTVPTYPTTTTNAFDRSFTGFCGSLGDMYTCCGGKLADDKQDGDHDSILHDNDNDEQRSPKVVAILDATTSNDEVRDDVDKDANDDDDDESIAYNKPTKMSTEELDERYVQAKSLLVLRKYNGFVNALIDCQELLSFKPDKHGDATLLHVLASQDVAPPDNIILQAISQDPAAVNLLDARGNTPLHCAAKALDTPNLKAFFLLLKFCRSGASQQNIEGNLPLHIVAASGARGAEKAVAALLEVNPRSLVIRNNSGKVPLHMAFTEGSGNTKCLKEILASHKEKKITVSDLDDDGNTPLHSAIKYCASYEAISTFRIELDGDESFLSPYLTKDRNGDLPLHCALKRLTVDSRIISLLLNAAPFTGGCENKQGEMPVELASSANLPSDVVIDLLKTDMPIQLGHKNGSIVEREHGHSWWHVAIQCQDRYSEALSTLLEQGTFAEIVGLARSTGPDGQTLTIDAAPAELKAIFHDKLRFLGRYDISTDIVPYFNRNVQIFSATDSGVKDDTATKSLPLSKAEEKRAVTLRCYSNSVREEVFQGEIDIRRDHNISSTFVEDIKASYKANRDIVPGAAQLISFARPAFTVEQLLEVEHEKNLDWLTHCKIILKQVAQALQHLHNSGIIHGHLDPSLIGSFAGKWKIMEIGRSTTLGFAMNGEFRSHVPPEAIVDREYRRLTSQKKSIQHGADPTHPLGAICENNETATAKKKGGVLKGIGASKRSASDSDTATCASKRSDYLSLSSQKKNTKILAFKKGDLGLGDNGSRYSGRTTSSSKKKTTKIDQDIVDNNATISDRIISIQEEEIKRLRQALADKEREMHMKDSKRQARNETKKNKSGGKSPLFAGTAKQSQMHEAENTKRFRFAPETCMASPAWDAFAFGEIMAELFLTRSLALPVFESSDERIMNRLSCFDEPDVDLIYQEVRVVAGDLAADLVARLLDPSPLTRLSTMSKILCHRYFHEDTRLGVVGSNKANKGSRFGRKKDDDLEEETNLGDTLSFMTP